MSKNPHLFSTSSYIVDVDPTNIEEIFHHCHEPLCRPGSVVLWGASIVPDRAIKSDKGINLSWTVGNHVNIF